MTDSSDRLDLRTGLPDALRVLLDEYPRDHWGEHPGFNGLISFWLDRHMMFRKIMTHLREDTESLIDARMDAPDYGNRLSRLGSMFVGELHGHHNIEDAHYFPVFKSKDARIARGFEILDRDHHAMDDNLNRFVEGANTVLGKIQAPDGPRGIAPDFLSELARLERLLDRHLIDEEELVVPVVLKYGADGLH